MTKRSSSILGSLLAASCLFACSSETTNSTGAGNGGSGNVGNDGGGGSEQGGGGAGGSGGQGGGPMGTTVDFDAATHTAGEDPTTVEVVVTLGLADDETLAADLNVPIEIGGASTATEGEDFEAGPFEAVFPTGSADGATAIVAIVPAADVAREDDEDIVLAFGTVSGVTAGPDTTVTIVDDDALLVGHSRFIGSTPVNMDVDVQDPGSPLTQIHDQALGFVSPSGSAYDSVADVIYLVSDGAQDVLGRVDPVTGELTVIGPTGWQEIQCLAFDPNAGILYGIDDDTNTLLTLDVETGRGTAVGAPGGLGAGTDFEGCDYDPNANVLYAVDDVTNNLVTIDTTTGTPLVVGSTGAGTIIEALAFDPATNTLYGANQAGTDNLVTIDTGTGLATTVANFSDVSLIQALTYDSTGDVLVGFDNISDAMLDIDTSGATLLYLGLVGALNVEGMAYDPDNAILYGATADATLAHYDAATGAFLGGVVLDDPDAIILGLAYDSNGDHLYGFDDFGGDLVEIDPVTGVVTPIGGTGEDLTGLAYDDATDTLYGCTDNEIFEVDVANGTTLSKGTTDIATELEGLEFIGGLLYGIEDYLGAEYWLYTIDPANANDTIVGFSAGREVKGLASDGTILWGLDVGRGALATFDIGDEGQETLLQSFAVVADGLAYDPTLDFAFATEWDRTFLWQFDFATGNATQVGIVADSGGQAFFTEGLAIDDATGILYGASDGTLVTIDTITAERIPIGAFDGGTGPVQGLDYDDANDILYGVTSTELVTIDVATGAVTLVGTGLMNHNDMRGLAYDPVSERLFGVDQGIDAGEYPSIVLIDTTTGVSTQLRATGRGSRCDDLFPSLPAPECSLARAAAFAN